MNTTRLALAVALGSLTACAVDVPPTVDDEPIGDRASALAPRGVDLGGADLVDGLVIKPPVYDPPPLEPVPVTPVPTGQVVRITSDELDSALLLLLNGTRLVVDTTRTSPVVYDDVYHCFYPNKEIREREIAECMKLAGSARSQCLQWVNEEYPDIKECGVTGAAFHSYIDFGPAAEEYAATDIGFEGIDTIKRNSWGPGSVTVDLNYIRSTINYQTTQAWFSPEPNNHAAVNLSLKLESNQPTIICVHSALACPDIELTNMKLTASLKGIQPLKDDYRTLGFETVDATFTFERNLNNVPDDFVTLFLDVDKIIKNNVEKNVERALGFASSRAAISRALTELVKLKAKQKNGSIGIDRFYNAWTEDGGATLAVDYFPCPKNIGCGVVVPPPPGGPVVGP